MSDKKFISIEEFFSKTLPDLQNNPDGDKTVVFIGAGLSRNYGCSGWNELAESVIKECHKLPNGFDYLTYQDIITTVRNPKTLLTIGKRYLDNKKKLRIFKKCLNKSLNNSQSKINKSNSGVYYYLKDIFNYFITTNADRHIDNFFDRDKIYYRKMPQGQLSINTLYKIHGCISDINSMVFTTDEYLKQYLVEVHNVNEFKLGNFLQYIFQNYNVIFIGYGLTEFELLERMIGTSQTGNVRHYIINGYYEHQTELINVHDLYFKAFNVKQVVYFLNENGHAKLTKEIEQYYNKKLSEINKPLAFLSELDEALEEGYE